MIIMATSTGMMITHYVHVYFNDIASKIQMFYDSFGLVQVIKPNLMRPLLNPLNIRNMA